MKSVSVELAHFQRMEIQTCKMSATASIKRHTRTVGKELKKQKKMQRWCHGVGNEGGNGGISFSMSMFLQFHHLSAVADSPGALFKPRLISLCYCVVNDKQTTSCLNVFQRFCFLLKTPVCCFGLFLIKNTTSFGSYLAWSFACHFYHKKDYQEIPYITDKLNLLVYSYILNVTYCFVLSIVLLKSNNEM